jgi:hypothetical protein
MGGDDQRLDGLARITAPPQTMPALAIRTLTGVCGSRAAPGAVRVSAAQPGPRPIARSP